MLVQAWHRGQLSELRYAGNGMRYSDSTAASAAFQSRTVRTMRVVGTVSRLIQLSPRIAVGFGYCLCEPALLLGGRKLGNEVDPIVNQLIVLGPNRKLGVIAKGEVLGFDIGQSGSPTASVRHGLCSLHRRHI